jgi:hypothetical protein
VFLKSSEKPIATVDGLPGCRKVLPLLKKNLFLRRKKVDVKHAGKNTKSHPVLDGFGAPPA